MQAKNDTIARTIALFIALINQCCALSGNAPLDLDENMIYQAVSIVATIVTSLMNWWKNNSFTSKAIKADEFLKDLRAKG